MPDPGLPGSDGGRLRVRDLLGHGPGVVAMLLATSIVQVAPLLPVPLFVQRVLDHSIPERDTRELFLIGLALTLLQVTSAVATVLTRDWLHWWIARGMADLRDQLVAKIYRLPLRRIEADEDRELHDVLVTETTRVELLLLAIYNRLVPAAVFMVAVAAVLVIIDPLLFAVTFSFTPVFLLVHQWQRRQLGTDASANHLDHRRLSDGALRILDLLPLTVATGAQESEIARQRGLNQAEARSGRALDRRRSVHEALLQTVIAGGVVLVLVIGGYWVISGRITIGALFAFYAGVALIRTPLHMLTGALPQVAAGIHSWEHVQDVLSAPEAAHGPGSREASPGTLTLERVGFHYGGRSVLRDASFELRRGTITALIGPNGAGKSTIARLILGLYAPTEGRLLADGVPYAELDLAALRARIGVVFQEPLRVPGTVRANLTYGRPDLQEPVVRHAAELAGFSAVVDELSDGYETVLGPGGMELSRGQLQRLAIARALAGEPDLLILDEPTNHLDRETVGQVTEAIATVAAAPAVLMISHDPRVVEIADEVLWLVDGAVLAGGPAEDESRPFPTGGTP